MVGFSQSLQEFVILKVLRGVPVESLLHVLACVIRGADICSWSVSSDQKSHVRSTREQTIINLTVTANIFLLRLIDATTCSHLRTCHILFVSDLCVWITPPNLNLLVLKGSSFMDAANDIPDARKDRFISIYLKGSTNISSFCLTRAEAFKTSGFSAWIWLMLVFCAHIRLTV